MEMLLEYLMKALGIALAACLIFVVEKYIKPWLKLKIGNEEYDRLVEHIQHQMAVAEQQFGPKTGEEKKQFVIDELKKMGLEFDEKMVSNLVDGFTSVLTAEGVINVKK